MSTTGPTAPSHPDDANAVVERQLLRSTLANYVGKFITLASGLVLTPFMLHQLGATDYALWVLVTSFVAYGALLDLGVGAALTKYVAEFRARGDSLEASRFIATGLRLYAALGLVALAASIPVALVFPDLFNIPPGRSDTARWLVLLAGASLAFQLPATTTYSVLRGLQRFDLMNLVGSVATIVTAIGTVVVLLLGGGVIGVAALVIPVTLASQIPMLWMIRRVAPDLHLGWRGAERRLARTVAGFSLSIVLVNGAEVIKKKTDELVIAAFLPVARVAPYAVARRLSDVPEILTYQFVRVLMPLASHLHGERDAASLRAVYVASMRITLGLFLPVGASLAVLAEPVLEAWVGERYATDAQVVLVLIGASFIDMTLWPAASMLLGSDRHRTVAWISAASALLNLVLSVMLVRRLGVIGVALGTLIANVVECAIMLPYGMRQHGVTTRTALHRVLVPAAVPLLPTLAVLLGSRHFLDPGSLLAVAGISAVAIAIYAAVYIALVGEGPERRALRLLLVSTRGRRRRRA
jgi:O-antigen/teichoic acid export membrane protein